MNDHEIINTSKKDMEFIFHLFEEAINYQKQNGFTVWKGYDKDALNKDMENGLQYKIVSSNTILCVYSVCYSDRIIWRHMEEGNAIYIHRAVVNPQHRGQNHFEKIFDWAIKVCEEKGLKYIRMDTWADNQKIIDYYKTFGFEFIENYTTPNTSDLPIQHRNLGLALLQYPLGFY